MRSFDTRRAVPLIIGSLLALIVSATVLLRADDGAASIAAGGVVVMRREPRISMAQEVLQISSSKVLVDYDFRNDSDQDITTEVAFPIPKYGLGDDECDRARLAFDDFKLWIDGTPARYQIEARAFLKETEHTRLLTRMHVDIATFGYAPSSVSCGPIPQNRDIQRLTADQRRKLERAGLVDEHDEPLWQVQKKYYWQQTFAAHKSVHIRHVYKHILGNSNALDLSAPPVADPKSPALSAALLADYNESQAEVKSLCIDDELRPVLQKIVDGTTQTADDSYVDFILTSANTWKMPIEEFTLIVERPHWKEDNYDYVSFCWDGPITKVDDDHFRVHATNLVPAKELRIGFIGVSKRRF
jgi:Domain of unknown function (DUF4424)